jgi:hypothetical protein
MVLRQIALLVKITPLDDPSCGLLTVQDVDDMQPLRLDSTTFVLSLTLEPASEGSAYTHGFLRVLDSGSVYPIRSSRSLYDAVKTYLSGQGVDD